MANLEIDGVRMSGGTTHAHITDIFGPGFGQMSRSDGVREIEDGLNTFYVAGRGMLIDAGVRVRVVRPFNAVTSESKGQASAYLRTVVNGSDTNNLLTLPKR